MVEYAGQMKGGRKEDGAITSVLPSLVPRQQQHEARRETASTHKENGVSILLFCGHPQQICPSESSPRSAIMASGSRLETKDSYSGQPHGCKPQVRQSLVSVFIEMFNSFLFGGVI